MSTTEYTMSLYPSLEALVVGKEIKAQTELAKQIVTYAGQNPCGPIRANYNELAGTYLGLDLACVRYDDYGNACYVDPSISATAIVAAPGQPLAVPSLSAAGSLVKRDPIDITNSVRAISVHKNERGCVGVQLRELDAGVFITYVERESPASAVGLRFGDQILRINSTITAGLSGKKAMSLIKDSPSKVNIIIRDRPLERTILLNKNSHGSVGIAIKDGKVSQIVKDSSAARNGVLIDHQILEVNGRNVIGLKDKIISSYMEALGTTVKLTVIPSVFFEHMIKKLGHSSMKHMDRSAPIV